MPSTTVMMSIGILVVSFILGIGYFYFISSDDKYLKKKQVEEVTSLLINFVIYIWLGKIVSNLPKFMSDPLAILAYPSDSKAFYLANIFLIVNIVINMRKMKRNVSTYLVPFMTVFFSSSLVFEFLLVILDVNTEVSAYIFLLSILLVIHVLLIGKVNGLKLVSSMIFLWASGQISLILINGSTTVFNYTTHILYFIMFITCSVYLYLKKEKEVS